MTVRVLAAVFFLLYGSIIPIAASDFMMENFVATLAMMASCYVIAVLLWSGRAVLLNILLAFYVLRIYLTRPYVDVFLPNLDETQSNYIRSNNLFFNSSDAAVVYLSLLSLLLAWLLGLLIAQSKQTLTVSPPWIFLQVDKIVMAASWPFWVVWVLLSMLNFKSATELWQGIATGESSSLFAFGLLSTVTINFVCLCAYLLPRQVGVRQPSMILLVPLLISITLAVTGGSRGAVFIAIIFALSYWLFLNYGKRISRRDLSRIILLALFFPVVIFSGLIAQLLRPLARSGADAGAIWEITLKGLDLSDSNNPLIDSLYFGLTELLHRLSSLQAQFMILNDHFAHDPYETFNPLSTLMRLINELVPGDVFDDLLSINQLYNYIYHDQLVFYNSETWGLQSTLYLYFGFWLSPIIVFLMAYGLARHLTRLDILAKVSPAFAAFFILLFNEFIEFGSFERVIPVDIVRPLASFLAVILLVRLLHILFSAKQKFSLSASRIDR